MMRKMDQQGHAERHLPGTAGLTANSSDTDREFEGIEMTEVVDDSVNIVGSPNWAKAPRHL
jgi:hypothetical protein